VNFFVSCSRIFKPVPAHLQQPNQDNDYAFFVHPSEGPNYLIVSPKLNGSNYIAWNRSMQWALGRKNKVGFINGSTPIHDLQDLNHNAWEGCNHLVQSWFINSVSDSIAQTIVFYDSQRFGRIFKNDSQTLIEFELLLYVPPQQSEARYQIPAWLLH